MTSGEITGIVTVVGSLLSFLGITGIDSSLVSGAVTGVISLLTIASALWTWWQHRNAVKTQQ